MSDSMMIRAAFHVGTHPYSYRSGEHAEIIGVRMVKPRGRDDYRACLHVRYADGVEDFVTIEESKVVMEREAAKYPRAFHYEGPSSAANDGDKMTCGAWTFRYCNGRWEDVT